MATLEQRVERLERRQLKIWRRLRSITKALYTAANNGLLPNTCRALFKQEHDEAEREAE